MAERRRRPEGTFQGFLNVHKPLGMTSFDVIATLRRAFGVRRLGHAGTLDPQASGVLPVAIGQATRLLEHLSHDKVYRASLRLGVTTDTLDAAGRELEVRPVPPVAAGELTALLATYVGWRDQVPPMASALHHQGRRLHELFREGQVLELPPRRVRFDQVTLVALELPSVVLDVACGGGTYVRSLARDLGEQLGCGAHLAALQRTRSGALDLRESIPLEALVAQADDEGALRACLVPAELALADLATVHLDGEQARRLRHGLRIPSSAVRVEPSRRLAPQRDPQQPDAEVDGSEPPQEPILLVDERGQALGVGRLDAQGMLRPVKVLVPE